MNSNTVEKLNKLNHDFYTTTAKEWDDSRSYSWKGWSRLIKEIEAMEPFFFKREIRILDIGCGNGRFIEFLQEKEIKFDYTGVDFNEDLLRIAKQRYNKNKQIKFIQSDLLRLDTREFDGKFDLIVSFGVMHHIPGLSNRVQFIKNLIMHMEDNGYLVLTLWKFNEFERFKKKIASPEKLASLNINEKELEENDYILDWKRGIEAYRYAHYIDISETGTYIHETKADLYSSFRADGKEENVNEYLIMGRDKPEE